ncbi:MAG: homocitrate synthase [Candidatus Marinimicrobia bacterium]|nr:homocitrate synthase [Candidatus Neomarinimicrobiota bacterium]MCF7830020.1 homocitrate synthase [Candidatus Neomarinimicrobiota bacterium]MCF7881938.1 homocitrate synthase [Candidatus Neomarinimicrobiota bacterium]
MKIGEYSIIESTLREGEQFVNAFFTTGQKKHIAELLDDFGVEYLELTSPCASPQSKADIEEITKQNYRAKILTHTRCTVSDAKIAVETGVDGVDVVIGTSSYLREFSHGKSIDQIIDLALEVIDYLKSQNVEVRFSTEDSLRSENEDLFRVYEAVDEFGVDRVGIADTVGVGTPLEIYELVKELRSRVACDIEFHGHNDSGCAIANAFMALQGGATHIDTSVLGIGERNGITPLGGLIARLYATDKSLVEKYDITKLDELDHHVAELVNVDVPFNNYITGYSAFTHKAGIHAKAILNNPATYEILKPEDFGLSRYIHIAHRLTGWNAVRQRAQQLGLSMEDEAVKALTQKIKTLADDQHLTLDDVDAMLHHVAENDVSLSEAVSEVVEAQ